MLFCNSRSTEPTAQRTETLLLHWIHALTVLRAASILSTSYALYTVGVVFDSSQTEKDNKLRHAVAALCNVCCITYIPNYQSLKRLF